MLKRLFLFFILFKCFGAFSQKSIVVEKKGLGSVNDTIVVKIDTAKKRVVLFINKSKASNKFSIKKVKIQSDSVWSFKLNNENDSALSILNRYASSEDKIDSAKFSDFFSLKKDTIFLVFKAAQSVVSGPEQTGIEGGDGINTGDPKKSFFEKHLTLFLVLLIIFFICSIVFFILWRLESKKIKSHNNEKEIIVGYKIFEELKKFFPEGLQSKEYKEESPQLLIEHIATIHEKSKNKIESLEDVVKNAKESDKEKQKGIEALQNEIQLLNSKLAKISKEHEDKLNDYRASIIEICKKMLVRYREFNDKYRGRFDEELAKKEILQFNIAYTQLAFDVFATLAESATEEAKMNIELLNGKAVAPIGVVDQFAEIGSVSPVVNLIIQILVDNEIKRIDGVYFKGNKIDLK